MVAIFLVCGVAVKAQYGGYGGPGFGLGYGGPAGYGGLGFGGFGHGYGGPVGYAAPVVAKATVVKPVAPVVKHVDYHVRTISICNATKQWAIFLCLMQ